MNEYIAYCGLDCETCEARQATVNNDDELRIRPLITNDTFRVTDVKARFLWS